MGYNVINANLPVGVFDSGVGGLTVLRELKKRLPFETFLYLGDNANMPYGNKRENELLRLVSSKLETFMRYKVKALVIACNTLSVRLIDKIKGYPFEVFGVYPPVYENRTEKVLLLATKATAVKYKSDDFFTVFPCESLAADIERNVYNLNKVNLKKHFTHLTGERFDAVVLGCTHYVLIEKEISKFFNAKTLSGNKATAKSLKNYLYKNSLTAKNTNPETLFLGGSADKNRKVYDKIRLF